VFCIFFACVSFPYISAVLIIREKAEEKWQKVCKLRKGKNALISLRVLPSKGTLLQNFSLIDKVTLLFDGWTTSSIS
jgi:hypothetical protein